MEYLMPLAQFAANVSAHPDKIWLHQPDQRIWRTLTWSQADLQARRIASALLAQGFVKGDKIAILAKNSAEWFITDLAIMMAGMVSVPIYATAGVPVIQHVMNHSEAKAVFVGKLDNVKAAQECLVDNKDTDLKVITYSYPTISGTDAFNDWLEQYEPLEEVHSAKPEETFTLVYTSGSTGLPKGVVLTYDNIGAAASDAGVLQASNKSSRSLSYLPLAHITERGILEIMSIYNPQEIFFNESLETFIEDVRYARPTTFISVPRLWTRFQARILEQVPDEKLQKLLKIPVVGKLVSRKIRKGLGLDKADVLASGSAPISPGILDWYARLGMNISEGWGMTETSGLSASNYPYQKDRVGTIGTAQDCLEMSLSDDGEILARGPAVFSEYYKNPEATKEAFVDGWFRTGDKGIAMADGSWKITGRVKEQFKTAKGKYVAPVPIESLLARNPDIEQVCVMGIGRKQPLALVVMNPQLRKHTDQVRQELEATLAEVNSELESHSRLDHLIISDEVWSIENDLLTPTLKLRRNKLEERYGRYLELEFKAPVVWESDLTTEQKKASIPA